jgi:BirA family transcriptional regulator, biotin operon repressor / biotin---[acetyl-CoA-carboxylase] ligase
MIPRVPARSRSQLDCFRLQELRAGIKPLRLHFFSRLRSTNDHAAAMRERGDLYAPAIVLTSRQIAGRGRGTHSWFSTAGVLTVTFVMPIEEHLAAQQIPLVAGLAVRDAVAQITGRDDIQLKWPNDILHDHRKLAGLLCERVDRVDLIGLGLNVNLDERSAPKALRDRITSLSQISRESLDMTQTLIQVARQLYAALSRRGESPFSQILRRYQKHHALTGKRVTVSSLDDSLPLRGIVQGLDSQGRLILRDRSKTHHVVSGQVQME